MLVPHLLNNIFRSGLTLVSSNDIITIKIDKKSQENKQTKKFIQNKNLGCQHGHNWETNYDYEMFNFVNLFHNYMKCLNLSSKNFFLTFLIDLLLPCSSKYLRNIRLKYLIREIHIAKKIIPPS